MKAFLRCLMLIAAIAVPWAMSAQTPTETLIGSESSTTTDKYPVNDYYNYSLSETIIDASEIVDGAQTINSISLYYNYASPMTSKTNCTIYLQHTTKSTFSSSSDIEALSPNAVMVYTGSLNCTQGWNQFDFTNNFSYDGTSNLMVIVDDNSGDYDGNTYVFKTASCSGYKTLFWYNDNVNPDLSNTSAFSSNKNYYQARCVMKLNGFQGAVSCPRVASISASNVSAYTATVRFTPGGNETAWLGTINPPILGQSSVVLNDTVVNLFGLTPVTDYTVSVSAICGAGDTSFARSTSFRTTCAAYSIPFTENFDGLAGSTTPDCWTKMGLGTAATNSSTSYSHSGSMTLKFNGDSPNIIALPQFSAPTNTLELTLWTRPENFTNGSCGQFDVGYVTDLSDANSFVAIATYNFDDFSDVEERTVNYSNAPANATIALRHRTVSASWYWFVDDIDVHAIPSCPKPATASASAIDAHSGLVQWTPAMPDQNNFVVAYGLGTDPSTMTTISATGTSAVISGLSAMTKYNVFVKAVCGTDDESLWSAMTSFMTQMDCGTGYELKDFTLGDGTSSSSSYAFYASSTYPFGYGAPIFTAEEIGANNLYENNTINAIRLHVGTTGGTINDAHIYMSNVAIDNYTGASDTVLFEEMTEVYSGTLDCPANQWITIPLTTPFAFDANSNLMIRFAHSSTASAGVSFFYTNMTPNYYNIYGYRSSTGATASATKSYYRPNVEFMICSEVPSCFPVQSVTASNVNTTNANISWTLNDATQNSFTVAYGTTNDVAAMATATVSNTNVTLYGLTPNTTYYATVRANCDSEDVSSWYRTISFHTPCDVADSAIFFENFDSYTDNAIPDCWEMGWWYQNPTSGVKAQPFITSTTQKFGGSGRSMSLQDQGAGTYSYLSTQCLPIDRANKYAVSLQVYRPSASSYAHEGIKIWASPSKDDTTNATLLGYIHRSYTLSPVESATGWYQYEFAIPQSGNQYILIEGVSDYGAATYFDNLEVKEAPCIKNVPYFNDFESSEVNMTPLCWDNSASTSPTLSSNPKYIWGVYNYNGNNMIRMYNYFAQNGFATINTNPIIIPETDVCELKLDISNRASCGAAEILISTDGGNHFDMIDMVSSTSSTQKDDPGTFVSKTYNLGAYAGDTVIIRFNAQADYGSGAIFIDNFQIRPTNSCIEPTDVTATTASTTSVTVSWTAGDATQNTFAVAYGTGNDPETMDTIIVSGTNTAVVSGLTFEQNYNFYVKAICDETHSSYWSRPASAFLGYCNPAPTSVDNQGITNVSFGNDDETVNNSQRLTSAPYYGNFTSMIGGVAAADMANVNITYSTNYTYGTIIWVDWNNNLVFDGNEVVYAGEASATAPTVLNASFLIPVTQDTGYYRMRIAGADSYYDNYTSSIEAAANANPCPTGSYTIVHDYTLHVLPAPSCLKPTNVVASNITDNSADIAWSSLDTTQNNFVVAYGTGLNPDEMTTVTATSNSTTLTGLTNATTYNVFVKAVCSSDDESEWSNVCTFNTNTCGVENQCPVYISMADAYGDGWNGGALAVVDAADNTLMATFALDDYDFGTDSIFICKGRNYNLVWLAGPYDEEVSFVLTGANGDTIYQAEEPSAGFLTTFTGSCPITDSNVYVVFAVNNGWMGNTTPATGEYTYHIGDIVNATATANPGYEFVNWNVNVYGLSNNVIVGNPYTDVIPELYAGMHVTITANFQAETFDVTALSNDNNLGIVTGSGSYNNGDIATLIATPSLGCRFVQWNDGDTNATRTVVVTSDSTFTATFDYLPINVVLAINNSWMGNTMPAPGAYTYHVGDTVIANATANTGFAFINWTISNGILSNTDANNPLQVVIPATLAGSSIEVTANFDYDQFTITALSSDTLLGTVTGSGTYNNGATATLVATPALNCRFVQWNDGDTSTTRTIIVSQDSTFTATFEYLPVNVVIAVNNGWMGNTTPATGAYTYHVGDTVIATATANTGYIFSNWSVSNGALGNTDASNPIQFIITEANAGSTINLTANFDYNQYTITALSNNTDLGSVTGSGIYNYGTTATLVATPALNCRFVQWNDGDTNATRAIVVSQDSTFTATFEYMPVNVILAINNGWMGSTMPAPGAYTYHVGDTVIANATANDHYHFVNWSVSNGAMSYDININPAFFEVPSLLAGMNITVTANFAIDQHTITAIANPESMGTVLGSGTFDYGATDTLVAIANRNTRFVSWSDGDTNATRIITVTGDATYTANFEYRPITINLATSDTMMGTTYQVPGTYTYLINDTLNAVAIANPGYHFDFWTINYGNVMDTVVSNPVEIILPTHMAGETITVMACFSVIQNTITAIPNNAMLGTVTGGGVYNYGSSAVLTATPAANAHFVNWNDGDTNAVRTIVVLGDRTLVANFAYDPFNVTFAVNDETMGTIDPVAGTYAYQIGNTLTANANANYGYRFVNWTISGMGADTTFDNSILNINLDNTLAGMNATITANFEVRPYHTLTLNIKDVNGNANVGGTVTGSGDYFEGESVTITATPDQYFEFAGWVNASGDVVYASSTKTFVMGTSDVELTAVFAYTAAFLDVTVNNDEMGYILINGERANHYDGHVNDNVEITAVANDGYRFLMWVPSVGNTSNTITYTLDNPVCAINAVFAKSLDITDVVDNYVIFSENGSIVVRGAEQQTIRVFDVVGRLLEQRNDSNSEEIIPMTNTGIYLIQVGDAPARRVVVRR